MTRVRRQLVGKRATWILSVALLVAYSPGLMAQSRLEGTVRGFNGRGVPNAAVTLLGIPLIVFTDEGGRFSFSGLPAGTYTVRAQAASGDTTRAEDVQVLGGGTTEVGLWIGAPRADWRVLEDSIPLGHDAVPSLVFLYADSVGVALIDMSEETSNQVRDSVEDRGLTFVSGSSGVLIFGVPQHAIGDTLALRDSAFARATRLESELNTLVWKVGPIIRLRPGGTPLVATDRVIVEVRAGVTDPMVRTFVHSVGGEAVWRVPVGDRRFIVRARDGDGMALATRLMQLGTGRVIHAQVDLWARLSSNSALSQVPGPGAQWHLKAINVDGAEARVDRFESQGGSVGRPRIAVIDAAGFDTGHPALVGVVAAEQYDLQGCGCREGDIRPECGKNAQVPLQAGSLAIPACGSPQARSDPGGHGTAAAALAVTNSNDKVRGVCTNCELLPIGYAGASLMQAGWALEWAADNQADVVSWSERFEDPAMELFDTLRIDEALAKLAGTPVVMGIGNEAGVDPCAAAQLQSLAEIIAVGASNHRDYGIPAGRGDCLWILAPGGKGGFLGIFPPPPILSEWLHGIVTADVVGPGGDNPGSSPDYGNPDYTRNFGGTSAATPIVAGVIGLMMEVNPSLKVEEVKKFFKETADKIEAGSAGYDANGHSTTHGFGRVNACAAVYAALNDQGWAHCATNLRPWWFTLLEVLFVVLVVTLFLASWMHFGLCHPVTWIVGIASAFLLVLWIATKLGGRPRKLRWWLALGAALIVLVLLVVFC